jgi:hypothetical protein
MRKQMIENAAYEVATQIRAVEESIEAALGELADLQAKMVHARPITPVGYTTAQPAFEELADSTKGLIAARGNIGNCHVALAEAKQTIPGLRTVAWGDGDECPPKEARTGLRIVA